MTTRSFGGAHATGEDRRPSSGESNVAGQPPITPVSGLVSTDWLPEPSDGTQSPVVVSFIDFHAGSDKDGRQIAELGMKLAEIWPIMRGVVGLWLWRKPVEWRGGSLSIWDSGVDLRRFIRWPVKSDSSQRRHGFAPKRTCGLRATCQPVAKAPTIDAGNLPLPN